jgi:hypothetical protein
MKRLALEFKPADAWIGAYWERRHGALHVWVCLVPCFPIHYISKPRTLPFEQVDVDRLGAMIEKTADKAVKRTLERRMNEAFPGKE